MAPKSKHHIVKYQGIILVLVGIIATSLAIHLGSILSRNVDIVNTSLLVLQAIGIALFGFGFFSIILESRNWREYFADRVREIIIEETYLQRLGTQTLKSLQIRALKALLRDPTIDREGSFLDYFNTSLHGFISAPYREDVRAEIQVRGHKDGCLSLLDQVTYKCRLAGDGIQGTVSWTPDPKEFESIKWLKIRVQFPTHHERSGEWVQLCKLRSKSGDDLTKGVQCALEDFKEVDGLFVEIKALYSVEASRFQYWQMADPTRNFDFYISFPEGYEIQMKPLVLHEAVCHTTIQKTFARVRYDSWMLPRGGVAWKLTPP